MARISKRTVDAATPTNVRTYLWDDKLSGFGLVIQPTGLKSYVFQYRLSEGTTRRLTIGRHGDPWTPEQARDRAEELAQIVKHGGDPLGAKQAARHALTVGDVFDRYLDSPKFAEKADSTRAIDRGRIDRHLRPLLGRKVANNLTVDEVRDAFRAIETGKTAADVRTGPRGRARVTGGTGAARMAVRLLRAVLAWAVEALLIDVNAAANVKTGSDGKREAVIETGDEYTRVFKAIDKLEAELKIRRPAADAIRVIALTGARRGEIAGLRWRHVNARQSTIVLPVVEHKTGRKTGDVRTIGLPAVALAIVERQPRGEAENFVFRPARGKGAISLNKPWRLVRAEAGLSRDLVLHSLRHSLATAMAMEGAEAGQIMAVMGHRSMSTAQRYVHVAKDKRAELAEQAATTITAALFSAKKTKAKDIP